MKEEKKDYNNSYIFIVIIFVAILIVAVVTGTYAFFKVTSDKTSSTTTVIGKTDCLDVQFESLSQENNIKLTYNYPISDDFALKNNNVKPVQVKLTNNCSNQSPIAYSLILTTLSNYADTNETEANTFIPASKIRANIKKQVATAQKTELFKTNYLSNLTKLNEESNTHKLLFKELDSNTSVKDYTYKTPYIVEEATIDSGDAVTYETYLWIDYYEGDANAYENPQNHDPEYDNSTEGKDFKSILTLVVNSPSNTQ